MNALMCLVFILREFFGASFGDELDNVVTGINRKALPEVISELTPRFGACLDLCEDIDLVLQG